MGKRKHRLTGTAAVVAAAFLACSIAPEDAQAGLTVPVISSDGVHYADLNIQLPGEFDDRFNGEYEIDEADRGISAEEIAGLKLGFDYFWDVLGSDFQANGPVQILLVPLSFEDDNAFALSPNYGFVTELTASWVGTEGLTDNVAVIGVDLPLFTDRWHTSTLPVLPAQNHYSDLPGTMLHELYHAFGLSVSYSYDEKDGSFYFDRDDINAFSLGLHDFYGRSAAELIEDSQNGTINIVALKPNDEALPLPAADPNEFYIVQYGSGGWRYSGMYFSGTNVEEVLGAETTIAWPTDIESDQSKYIEELEPVPGLPINGYEPYEGGEIILDGSHIELQNSLMSHQPYRNWCVLMEAELALLQDIGFEFDRKRFFGYSVYGSGLTINNERGYWERNEAGTDWLEGFASHQDWGIGLHVYGSNNTITQSADLLADGTYGIGARIDGSSNDLTIASGTTIQANGVGGKGILFSWGKEHNLTVKSGATVSALGQGGIAVAFDFGSNEMGDYWAYLGSYTLTYVVNDTFKNRDYLPEELKGPLVKSLTVAGSLSGGLASIYISPNAYVKDIFIAPGADISGDIISLWDPDETFYGTEHIGYDGYEPLVTTLTFGSEPSLYASNSEQSVTTFSDNITSNGSIVMQVASGTLKFSGTASVLGVTVDQGAILEGGTYVLSEHVAVDTSGSLINSGSLVSTGNNPVVIAGDYVQNKDASLTLSVSGGQLVPLTVEGSATFEGNAQVLATIEGGWNAEGQVALPETTQITTADSNPTKVSLKWAPMTDLPSSPTLEVNVKGEEIEIHRYENAYSRHVTGKSKDVARIFDASASTLTDAQTQAFFASLDWSDTSGSRINRAARALSGTGIVDGISSALMLDRLAGDALVPGPVRLTSDGSFAWANPFGGSASAFSAQKTSLNAAGIAGGWIHKSGTTTTGVSVAALQAEGDSDELCDLDAKGLWVSGFVRNDLHSAADAFWEGSLRFGYMNSDESRSIVFDDFHGAANSDVNRWTLGGTLKAGLAVDIADIVRLEPFAQLSGALIYTPSYEESSRDFTALSISSEVYRTLEAQIGVALAGSTTNQNTLFWRVHASYGRELLSDAGSFTASFAHPDFKGSFDRTVQWDSRNRLRGGLTLGIESENGFSVNARLEGYRESADTKSLIGGIEAKWRF